MQTHRRYVVRLYCEGRSLDGVLEDARTGIERPFKDVRELVSLLRQSALTSSQSTPPKGGPSIKNLRGDTPKSKRKATKEDRT